MERTSTFVEINKEWQKTLTMRLLTVIEKEGNMTREAAEAYLNQLQKQGRYQRDVY